jgi:hypothetical protein
LQITHHGAIALGTFSGYAPLAKLPKLRELHLLQSHDTTKFVADLSHLTQLTHLSFGTANIDDKQLWKLGQLVNLEVLTMAHFPNVSDTGLNALRVKLPKCSIAATAGKRDATN